MPVPPPLSRPHRKPICAITAAAVAASVVGCGSSMYGQRPEAVSKLDIDDHRRVSEALEVLCTVKRNKYATRPLVVRHLFDSRTYRARQLRVLGMYLDLSLPARQKLANVALVDHRSKYRTRHRTGRTYATGFRRELLRKVAADEQLSPYVRKAAREQTGNRMFTRALGTRIGSGSGGLGITGRGRGGTVYRSRSRSRYNQ